MPEEDHSQFADPCDRSDEWMQAEEYLLLTQLSILRGISNDKNKAASLPGDVLEAIFYHAVDAPDPHIPRICITHVCRRWRDVALSLKSLWAVLSPSTQKVIEMCLQRSETTPLRLKSRGKKIPDAFWSAISANYWPSVVAVDLSSIFSSIYSAIQRLRDRQAWENLESLNLELTNHNLSGVNMTLLPEFQRNPPPKLHDLRLKGVSPQEFVLTPSPFPLYLNLRTFHLRWDRSGFSQADSTLLMGILANMPLLEDLLLVNTLPNNGLDQGSQGQQRTVVKLPHLRRLALTDGLGENISDLLQRILIPDTTYVFLHETGTGPTQIIYSNHTIFFYIPPLEPHRAFLQTVSSVELGVKSGSQMLVGYRNEPGKVSPEPCLKLLMYDRGSIWHSVLALESCFAKAPLRHLSVSVRKKDDQGNDWRPVLAAFPALETLTITNSQQDRSWYPAVLDALIPNFHFSKPPLVPALESLNFVHFKRSPELRKVLRQCIYSRQEANVCPPSFKLLLDGSPWSVGSVSRHKRLCILSDAWSRAARDAPVLCGLGRFPM